MCCSNYLNYCEREIIKKNANYINSQRLAPLENTQHRIYFKNNYIRLNDK